MSVKSKLLPGCYANFPSKRNESLPGYLLRLSEANGYDDLFTMLKSLRVSGHLPRTKALLALMRDESALKTLGRISTGVTDSLMHFKLSPIGIDTAVMIRGCRVDFDAILDYYAQVCPICLAENGYARDDWDIATVSVCSHHNTILLDTCPDCGERLTWDRPSLMLCAKCGSDLRSWDARTASAEETEVSDDFSALAPFRISTGENVQTVMWDAMFRLFKTFALSTAQWALMDWPNRYLAKLSAEHRHEITRKLSETKKSGTYHLTEFSKFASERLVTLRIIPKQNIISEHTMEFLFSTAAIPRELAEAISYGGKPNLPQKGHEVFGNRPLTLRSVEEVRSFLAINEDTLAGLYKRGYTFPKKAEHEGVDIDEVLAAQRFLTDGLLSLEQFAVVVGTQLDAVDVRRLGLLKSWNPYNNLDMRLAVSDVVGTQCTLTNLADFEYPQTSANRASKPVNLNGKPLSVVIKAVALASCGGLSPFGWGPPYRWSDLIVDAGALESLSVS
jgi:hypothetical protein